MSILDLYDMKKWELLRPVIGSKIRAIIKHVKLNSTKYILGTSTTVLVLIKIYKKSKSKSFPNRFRSQFLQIKITILWKNIKVMKLFQEFSMLRKELTFVISIFKYQKKSINIFRLKFYIGNLFKLFPFSYLFLRQVILADYELIKSGLA